MAVTLKSGNAGIGGCGSTEFVESTGRRKKDGRNLFQRLVASKGG
jgi:hypothetical protein